MKIFDLLYNGAQAYPENTAVVHMERRINYRMLLGQALELAGYLTNLGLAPGARVGLLYENTIEYVIAFFAISRAGFVAVPIDNSLNPAKMNFILVDCGVEALIAQAKYERHFPKLFDNAVPVKFLIVDKPLRQDPGAFQVETLSKILKNIPADGEREPSNISAVKKLEYNLEKETDSAPDELAAIFYTSGSAGEPKGVMLSHRNLISNTIATVEYLKLNEKDSVMVILPFYYIYGNSLLLTHVAVGGTLVIDNRFLYPEVILDAMEKERVTGFSGVPSNFMILLNNSSLTSRKLEHLRYFTQAGGAMAPEVVRRLINAFPNKEIYIMYGQTEAAPRVSYCPPERLKDKIGSIGIPVPGVTIRVVDENGREATDGEVGELAVSGPNVMLGYWNQPAEQAEVLRDGWLYTGDLAKKDKDGYFYIVGRKKEIIKVGGNRVSAKEIEERLLENPKVAEAAVFGVSDDILGEAVKAAIVLKEGCRAEAKEIRNFCKERLAEHKTPKYIVFLDSLPKYQSGKVNKLLLKEKNAR
jgi:acyl-CoA synthetase (AMP-forming)/AMP-acid ligase II